MFITKTINEYTENIEQFDLVDSICESYEDLLSMNEALARLDIKEQELIHTESAELDAFREDAMDKAKNMLENFINKLKMKYQAFIKWVNKQIINLFINKLEKYLSKDKDKFDKAIAWLKETNNSPTGKTNAVSKYFHKAVVKNNKVVPLKEFIKSSSEILYDILLDNELSFENIEKSTDNPEEMMKIDAVKLFKDKVEEKVGKFETINGGDKSFDFPIDSFYNFDAAIGEMESAISEEMGIGHLNRTEKDLKQIIATASKVSNNAFKLCNWRYIQFTKMVNVFLGMCRRYFMICVLSASYIVNAYEKAQKKEK